MNDSATATVPRTTMAVRVFEHGGPEKLVYDEYPLPGLGARDVLVKVHAASVSRWDVKYRSGITPSFSLPGRPFFSLPQQLGREAAGEIVAAGPGVSRFQVGDRVVGVTHPEAPDSTEAMRGLGNLSRGVSLPGHTAPGGYAQYVVRDEAMWLPVPSGIDMEQAALTLWPFSTAHRVLADRLNVHLADAVLITGASGGMGQATVQLARLLGMYVIAVTRSPAKIYALRALGADAVVVLDNLEEARAEIDDLTEGEGVQHVVDYAAAPELQPLLLSVLALGGKICVSAGENSSQPSPVTNSDFIRLELSMVGIRGARRNDARIALELLKRGRIQTPVAARFPLSEAAAAHTLLETSHDLTGRIVLDPWA
jgi:NADPH:quinone reductase-like Zn-dependent oxidoreductase